MSTKDKSAPEREGRDDNALDAEGFHACEGSADVDDGIDAADFVEVHLINFGVVDGGFGFTDTIEDAIGFFFDGVGEMRVIDYFL